MQSPARHGYLPIDSKVGIGQINREQRIIVVDGLTEEQGTVSPQSQDEAGEEPCPLMVEPLFAQSNRLYIAITVKHSERFTVLEHPGTIIGQGRCCQDIVLIGHSYDVVQKGLLMRHMWA